MRKTCKSALLILGILLLQVQLFSNNLVLIHSTTTASTRKIIDNPSIEAHFYNDSFVIATVDFSPKESHVILASNPWQSSESYYIVYANSDEAVSYRKQWSERIEVLYQNENLLIVASDESVHGQLEPARNDGMIKLYRQPARIPQNKISYNPVNRDPNPFIEELLAQVDHTNITATVQHLQDYGTRNAYHTNSVTAQNWIADQFTALGLEVEIMDFSMPSGAASDNVIASLQGTKYPNEYVICGAHYDSYSYSGLAPGADDNASGTAAVLEIARILSQHEFDRTLVFCAFSGEEYGLYGSAAYAARAAQLGMDIHGYFNLDMIGYLKPGNTTIKSSLIYPASAQELADFYEGVCATYLPDFVIEDGALSGGDSDHTSFNNNGFMGIFPFEAVPNYSPHIHTSNDIIGPSYNNAEQAAIFTQASLASIVTMSNRILPPRGLTAFAGDQMVELEWTDLAEAASYNIYRNGAVIGNVFDNSYTDLDVSNGTLYSYYVTAIYSDTGLESDPSNVVTATPMPPLVLPFVMNFENGSPYWEFTDAWGISTTHSHSPSHAITESPAGNYQNNVTSYAYLRPFNLNMGFTDAQLKFWTRYDLETNYDYSYLEISTNGVNWTQLAVYNGVQNSWQQKNYSLNAYLGQDWLQLRFRFESDYTVTKDGMYIDDFEISTTGGGMMFFNAVLQEGWNTLSSYILPQEESLEQLFAPIADKLIAVQTSTGLYYPAQSINTIGPWNPASGYKVKMNNPSSLMITGLEPALTNLTLESGWNLIPVLSACPVDFNALIASQSDDILMARDLNGSKVYWPQAGLNSMTLLQPGKAYLVKCAQSLNLVFPDCVKSNTATQEVPTVGMTSTAHNLAFEAGVFAFAQAGDQIFAFTPEGTAAGALLLSDVALPMFMALYGDDSLSTVVDGFLPGEMIQLKWWQASTESYYDLSATFSPQMPDQQYYVHNGMSHITAIVPDVVAVDENKLLIRLYPNPASDNIELQTNGFAVTGLELIYPDGKRTNINTTGGSQLKIDVAKLPKGVYVLGVQTSQGSSYLKFMKD